MRFAKRVAEALRDSRELETAIEQVIQRVIDSRITCEFCHKLYFRNPHSRGQRDKFCGNRCRQADLRERRKK